VVMEVAAVVMAETLASGWELIETLGIHLSVDMASYWTADAAFYDLLRDREVATAILAEVGGEAVASANAKEKGKTIKGVIADCLTGENGRAKVESWVPRWMAFPSAAYTQRGGVATFDRHAHFGERQTEEAEACHQVERQVEDERAAYASAENEMPEPGTLPEAEEMRLAA